MLTSALKTESLCFRISRVISVFNPHAHFLVFWVGGWLPWKRAAPRTLQEEIFAVLGATLLFFFGCSCSLLEQAGRANTGNGLRGDRRPKLRPLKDARQPRVMNAAHGGKHGCTSCSAKGWRRRGRGGAEPGGADGQQHVLLKRKVKNAH